MSTVHDRYSEIRCFGLISPISLLINDKIKVSTYPLIIFNFSNGKGTDSLLIQVKILKKRWFF